MNIYEEQKKLVLARFKTLNTESKIILGGGKEYSVNDLIDHIKSDDEFGRKVVDIQMKMLKILASV